MEKVKIYLDEDVRPLLAEVLRKRGYDALSCVEKELFGKDPKKNFQFHQISERNIYPKNAINAMNSINPINPTNSINSINPMNPLVSIVVTTKNEEKNITNCLNSMNSMNSINSSNSINSINSSNSINPKVEIIVVDNNSTDNTVKIAKQFTDKVYNKGPERSAQRNYGVKKAKGKYILYLDADMILSENIIQECVSKCEKEDCVALYIPEKIIGRGFWIKVRDFERSFYDATVIDCVRFVRKKTFEKVGGFDESLAGPEDWDFDRRTRECGKVGIIDAPLYHNEGEFNLEYYLKKKNYYSETLDKYIQKWGKNDKIIKKQLGFWYRYLVVFIENGKWKKLIRHPLLTLGIYLLKFMVGITYLRHKR